MICIQYFDVVGCDSGAVYRIHHGFQGSVEQLDGRGGPPVCRWCFRPEEAVVAGDVMLAQKIALDTHEGAAVRIANRLTPRL
jgi:hypothetical protein